MQTTARNGECYSSLVDNASTRAKGELVGERDSRKKAKPAAATAAKNHVSSSSNKSSHAATHLYVVEKAYSVVPCIQRRILDENRRIAAMVSLLDTKNRHVQQRSFEIYIK